MTQVAVVGAGLIGRAWSIVFARAGFDVALWDPYPQQVEAALAFIGERLPELQEAGLLKEPPALVAGRVRPAATLAEAVRRRRARAGERAGAGRRQAGAVRRAGSRCAARRGAGEFEQRHSRERLHRRPARPRALPGRASGQSAVPGPAGRAVPGAMDRSGRRGAHSCPDGERRAGAGDREQGDGRLRAEPAARRAARRGVPADRRRRDLARGPRRAGEARAWAALELHGAAGDDRPQRAGRTAGLLRALRRRCMPSCSSR